MDEETVSGTSEVTVTDNDALNVAALAAADQATNTSETDTTLPSDTDASNEVPEKFRAEDGTFDTDKLWNSYQELEKHKSSGEPDADAASNTDEDPTGSEGDDAAEGGALTEQRTLANDVLSKAGLSLDEMQSQYNENGSFTDEMYKTLEEKAGLPRALVKTWEQGLTSASTASAMIDTVAREAVGGEESYDEMTTWASEHLTDFEIEAYDKATSTGDLKTTLEAVKGLKARMDSEGVVEPSETLAGKPSPAGSVYENQAEYLSDMSDPRYDSDEAFRRKADAKALRSPI